MCVEMGPDLEVRESRRKRLLPLSWQVLGQQWLVASTGDKEGPRMSDLALQEEKDWFGVTLASLKRGSEKPALIGLLQSWLRISSRTRNSV